ncbi:MAG TPA: sugar phosphate nucleotidyltransferase [Thermoanaerobaculia bacterium]|nr:sugar phosphate nucleotidyltransferase [Thermoanaerobaculia bacterium]
MKAMILAAGYGTRLRPLTYARPKPMVPICNRPLIGYAAERFLSIGVREIVVNLHHLPEIIQRYLSEEYGGECEFHFSFEPEILGTGGGLRKVRPLLEKEEEFYLVNGDTIQFPPYDQLRAVRSELNAVAALTLRHPPRGDRFTSVWFEDRRITGFGTGAGEPLMFSGSHVISSRIFGYLPEREFSGIVDEVYRPLIGEGKEIVAGVVDDGPWFDIGTPQRYISAAATVLDMTLDGTIPVARGSRVVDDSVVDQTATIHGTVKRSSIGHRSFVKGEVRNSTIGSDCRIAGSAVLHSCILGDGVEINRPLELRSAIICRDDDQTPRDANYRYENGLVIADF